MAESTWRTWTIFVIESLLIWSDILCIKGDSWWYYNGQKIETTTRTRVQARALSSMHAPVVWHTWLSQFFGQGSSWWLTINLYVFSSCHEITFLHPVFISLRQHWKSWVRRPACLSKPWRSERSTCRPATNHTGRPRHACWERGSSTREEWLAIWGGDWALRVSVQESMI